jgi:hypothetical protein
MKRIGITIALLAVLGLGSACGEDQDPRVEKVRENAPTAKVLSDAEVLDLMEQVCQDPSKAPEMDPAVSQQDQGYILGLALATCE